MATIEILTIIFVVLKLVDVVEWPWLWVLSPLWIGAAWMFFWYFVGHLFTSGNINE